ncbi:MAG: TIR domain-containing protein [Actinomycetota bacterium]
MDLLADVRAHGDAIFRMRWSPTGARLATPSRDGSTRIWSREGQLQAHVAHTGIEANCVAWHPDESSVAIGLDDGLVLIADATSGAVLHEHRLREDICAAAGRPGDLLVGGDAGVLWSLDWSDESVAEIAAFDDWVFALATAPHSDSVAAGTRSGSVVVVSPEESDIEWAVPGVQVLDVCWQTSLGAVTAAYSDGVVRLMRPTDRAILAERLLHVGRTNCCRVVDGGGVLATLGADGQLVLSDSHTLVPFAQIEEQLPNYSFAQADLSPTADVVACPIADGGLRLWRFAVAAALSELDDGQAAKSEAGSEAVFISYTSGDRATVKSFVDKLEGLGVSTWMDVKDILPGEEWLLKLQRAIVHARAILIFVGPGETGPWARQEVQLAIRRRAQAGTPVIPVVLETGAAEAKLDGELAFLGSFHWVRASDSSAPNAIAKALAAAAL